jgi:hypothetical protein
MTKSRGLAVVVSGFALFLPLAACGGDGGDSGGEGASPTAAGLAGGLNLSEVCPDTIVVQEGWQPEAEMGEWYQLLGPGYRLDTGRKRVTGPLVADGKDTGVKLEIRSGGPAVGFQPVSALMSLDPSIHIGMLATDEAVEAAGRGQPVTAVAVPLERSPLAILWDPEQFPQFNTIADIGRTDTKVLYTQGQTYMDYLVGSGILHQSQLDGSYTGAPDLFVGAYRGRAAMQGFATSEPYLYEHELPQWDKPLRFQLLNDAGWVTYSEMATVRSAEMAALAPCLKRLVPIVQQAQIDFVTQPGPPIAVIVEAAQRYKTGWRYSADLANYSATAMIDFGIVSNGPDQTLGNIDMKRVQRVIDITAPILDKRGKPVKEGLKPEDLATNEFIDARISFTHQPG